jgi:hypothetical protein
MRPIRNVHIKECRKIFYIKTKIFCVLCGSHNLNLLLGDVLKALITAVNFFWKYTKVSIPHVQCQDLVAIFKKVS